MINDGNRPIIRLPRSARAVFFRRKIKAASGMAGPSSNCQPHGARRSGLSLNFGDFVDMENRNECNGLSHFIKAPSRVDGLGIGIGETFQVKP